jgi:hypothetical protein
MIHIGIYLKGERDYTFITGPTGPLVCALYLRNLFTAHGNVQLSSRSCSGFSLFAHDHRWWKGHCDGPTDIRCALRGFTDSHLRHLSSSWRSAELDHMPFTSEQETSLHICSASLQRLLVCSCRTSCHISIPNGPG